MTGMWKEYLTALTPAQREQITKEFFGSIILIFYFLFL